MGPPLTVLSLNVKKVDGPDRDWSAIAALLTYQAPDVVCVQELDAGKSHRSDPPDSRQAEALGRALGMEIRVADSPSRIHTAIAWRPGITLHTWEELTDPPLHHGHALAVLGARQWPAPLTVLCTHLTPYSVPLAAIEAQHLTAHLRRHGPNALLIGDINAPPLGDDPPPFAELPPHNRAARAVLGPGPLRPDLQVGYALAHADLIDAAAHLADTRGQPHLRASTGAEGVRADQAHLTHELAPALLSYERLEHDGLNDRHPIKIVLDMDLTPAPSPTPEVT